MHKKAFIFAMLTSVIWGMSPVIEKIGLSGKMDPYVGVVLRTIAIVVVSLLGLFVMGKTNQLFSFDAKSVFFVCLGGIMAGFLGQVTYYTALKTGEASVVVSITAIYPLISLIASVVFLGEAFTAMRLIGIILVVSGVLCLK